MELQSFGERQLLLIIIYSIVSLLPHKTDSSGGEIFMSVFSSFLDDDCGIVFVSSFCLPFIVSVQRIIVCWMSELRLIAGHETSDPLCHKMVSTLEFLSVFGRRWMLFSDSIVAKQLFATPVSISQTEFEFV